MMTKRNGMFALMLGLALAGTGTAAYASFTPGQLPAAVLAAFTSDEQAAITAAQDIRAKADVEADAVLTAAGVTHDELHTAMKSAREADRTAMDTALTNNDYDAYAALIAGRPDADSLTKDIFATLVEIRSLEVSGDKAGAMDLRKELRDAGYKGMMGGKGGEMGGGHGHGPRATADESDS